MATSSYDDGCPKKQTLEVVSRMVMKTLSRGILAAALLASTWVSVAQTDTDQGASVTAPVLLASHASRQDLGNASAHPALTLSARTLDFGSVQVGGTKQLSFRVQNVGATTLSGAVVVSAPFSILAGSPCALKPAQTQVITVQYAPKSSGMHMTVVHLTGAGDATVSVMGSTPVAVPAARPRPHRAPAPPLNLRLIAQR